MKNNLLILLIAAASFAAFSSARADISYTAAYDECPLSSSGFYMAVQGGLNLSQTTFSAKGFDADSGSTITVKTKSNMGGFAGIKLGSMLGEETSICRPGIELDAFYNQCDQDAIVNAFGETYRVGKIKMESGAFLLNGILKFQLGRIHPYAGAGAGVYTGELTIDNSDYYYTNTGFAWQILAGVDVDVTSRISVFTEYKFLNYMDDERLSQHLVGAGIRFHF